MLATLPLSIRPYATGDDDFIATLAHEAFDEFTPHAVSHTLGMVRRCTTLVALQAADARGRPAVSADSVRAVRRVRVGFVAIANEGQGTVVLNAIAVARSERGRGVGHRLMLEYERLARQWGAHRLELCTADCNLSAIELFQRQGFRIARRRTRFYGRGQDACIMVKDFV